MVAIPKFFNVRYRGRPTQNQRAEVRVIAQHLKIASYQVKLECSAATLSASVRVCFLDQRPMDGSNIHVKRIKDFAGCLFRDLSIYRVDQTVTTRNSAPQIEHHRALELV
jgi:hypothetical protein